MKITADFYFAHFHVTPLIQSSNLEITAMGTCVFRVSECVYKFKRNIFPTIRAIRTIIKGYILLISTLSNM